MTLSSAPTFKQIFTNCIGSFEDLFTRDVEADVPLSEEEQIENTKARYHLSQQQIDDFRDTFDQLDKDKNGTLDIGELRNAFFFWKQSVTDDELQAIMKKYDTDNNGTLEFPEFLELISEKQRNTNIELEYMQQFESYDQNHVGYLPVEQILIAMNVLKELDVFHNPEYSSDDVQSWLKMVNRDEDGSVKYHDWIKLLRAKNVLK